MLTPGHVALGYLVSFAFLKATHAEAVLGNDTTNTLLLIGSLMGTAPDIDFIPFFIKHRSLKLQQDDSHRNYITHAPLFWFLISLAAYSLFGGNPFGAYLGIVIWLATWSHFLADSLEYGIGWLRPFSPRRFAVWDYPDKRKRMKEHLLLKHYWECFRMYVGESRTFPFEVSILLVAIFTFLTTL